MAEAESSQVLVVGDDHDGLTALQLLGDHFHDVATSELRELIRLEGVLRNDQPTGPNQHLALGDRIEVWGDGLPRIPATPLKGFAVLHEDDHLLVCDKPPGVAVEAERGDAAQPFRSALLHHLRQADLTTRPRIAHRLDRDTSGLIAVAKTRAALSHMTRQFEERRVEKEYLALVMGRPPEDGGEIDRPLAPRTKRGRGREGDAKPARSRWEVLERFRRFAWVKVEPLTGRQHQVRQHLALLGLPIVGDSLYGDGEPLLLSAIKPGSYNVGKDKAERPLLGRMALHAGRLAFEGPGGDRIAVEAELPKDLRTALARLRKYG